VERISKKLHKNGSQADLEEYMKFHRSKQSESE